MRNIYHFSYDNIRPGTPINYQKLVLPKDESVYDLICHPSEKFIFAACSDSIIRIFDYSNISNIQEVKNGLVDIPLGKDNKLLKNQAEMIKKSNLQSVITLDINYNGSYLLSGNENGNIYLWDALSAIKNKRLLLAKERFSGAGIFSVKFIKTKQFENLNRFICHTKEGKFFILGIIMKEEGNNKIYSFNKLYENSIFNPIIYPLAKYNLMCTNFVNVSYYSNIICLRWPALRMDKVIVNEKKEDYLLFTSFNAKFFFIYDNIFPKINYAIATQMKYLDYEDYMPISNRSNLIFERKIFIADSFFIYCYDVMTGNTKRVINYPREFNLKNIFPLKFESKINEESQSQDEIYFVLLVENENNQKFVLLIFYDMAASQVKLAQKFEDVIDFTILGNKDRENMRTGLGENNLVNQVIEQDIFKNIFLLHKNRQHALIYNIKENKKETKNIEGSVLRVYWTPFCEGQTVLYRNILSELKFSSNLKMTNEVMDYRCINDNSFRLDYSERETDIVWKRIDPNTEKYLCAISMIEKIVITDENLKILYSFKISLQENPNIISSLYFIGKTLFYSKGNSINYFYGEDNIHQKVFSSDQPNTIISGILCDRYILVSKASGSAKDSSPVNNILVTTPMLNPLEPIMVGYLDTTDNMIDYNLVKDCVSNMFTNQFSQNLINKLLKKDLKEVAWVFLSDNKSSFQNIDKKIQILNDLLKFDQSLDYILPNKNLKNEMDLDELIWKLHYDHSFEYIKNILIGECNILISYGQFDLALKILELLGDYPKAINLLLISSTKDEYEKIKVLFTAKGCLSYTDNLLINNVFQAMKNSSSANLTNYNKYLDSYKGEPFIFGANQDKFNILSIKDAVYKINKKNSHISNFSKKILSYGETPFQQYVKLYNRETSQYEFLNICNLILQKIDQFYGHKNTIYEKSNTGSKQVGFTDYSVPLSNLKPQGADSQLQTGYEEDDHSIDHNAEEINENLFLSAYYHCDKGNGNLVEDISDNNLEGVLSLTQPSPLNEPMSSNNLQEDNSMIKYEEKENYYWTNVLEEFEPLEYEDKWGRKSPGSHAIKFSIKIGTNLKIKHTSVLNHFKRKFTVEFWLKIYNINVSIFSKESLSLELHNGTFNANYQNKILSPVKILDYQISSDKWTHVAFSYKKKSGKLRVFVNCEEVVNFMVTLSEDIGIRGDVNFGNSNLDGEITEIRIWNQEIPLKFIKENFKSPLPILAENKRKLRMKINKQEEFGAGKKKFGAPGEVSKNPSTNRFQSFAFAPMGKNNFGQMGSVSQSQNLPDPSSRKISMPSVPVRHLQNNPVSNNNTIIEDKDISINLNLSAIEDPDKNNPGNLYEFNPANFNPDVSNVLYPSLTSVIAQEKSVLGNNTQIINPNYNFEFNNNFDLNDNVGKQNETINFDFNNQDFNFDK
jgi:hypothetical protein